MALNFQKGLFFFFRLHKAGAMTLVLEKLDRKLHTCQNNQILPNIFFLNLIKMVSGPYPVPEYHLNPADILMEVIRLDNDGIKIF